MRRLRLHRWVRTHQVEVPRLSRVVLQSPSQAVPQQRDHSMVATVAGDGGGEEERTGRTEEEGWERHVCPSVAGGRMRVGLLLLTASGPGSLPHKHIVRKLLPPATHLKRRRIGFI